MDSVTNSKLTVQTIVQTLPVCYCLSLYTLPANLRSSKPKDHSDVFGIGTVTTPVD
jgi:hypothetical protein